MAELKIVVVCGFWGMGVEAQKPQDVTYKKQECSKKT